MSINIIFILILFGGWLLGKLFHKIKLPAILGMVFAGILLGYFLADKTPDTLWQIAPFLTSMALIVILLRAGLGINKITLKKTGITALLMAIIPCILEGASLTFIIHYYFNFNWYVSGMTAFMLSAVSPAVIVPSMLDLKIKGYSKKNDVPTIILAGASVDDVFAITIFSAFLSLATSNNINILRSIMSIPLSIILGIIPGITIGLILVLYFKKKYEDIRATEKTLLLLAGAMMLVQIGDWLHSAALLGVMAAGFIILEKSEKVAHEISLKLSKIWVFASIILFVLIGYSVDIRIVIGAGLKGIAVISIGLVFRAIGVMLATSFSKLSLKERVFCVIAYIPKATVQAALGGVALSVGLKEGQVILALAVLSIVFTAPIGLIGIKLLGHRLLHIDFPEEE